MWSYLRNQQSKQTNLLYLEFLSTYALFLVTLLMHTSFDLCRKLLKKNLEHESMLYNSTKLSANWISKEFQIQIISFSKNIKL